MQAGDVSFSSGERRIALIELYTSEGCSSCPPADRWLSQLKSDPSLWRDFIPLALHVDYWDYIGWKDRFAQRRFSDRQRQLAREGNSDVIYTPGFFRNGREWRGWRDSKALKADEKQAGSLSIIISEGKASLRFAPHDQQAGDLVAHIALLGMDLETQVRRGENHGKTLRHDFVVLNVVNTRMEQADRIYTASESLPESEFDLAELAVVAWVSERRRAAPIQAVGGYLSTAK